MTQRKIDDLFSSKTSSGKRSRPNPISTHRDEFDDIFETSSASKRRRTNNTNNPSSLTTASPFENSDAPLPSTTTKTQAERVSGSMRKKRSFREDDVEKTAMDELFSSDTRKKVRRPIKSDLHHEDLASGTVDLLDMFNTKAVTHLPPITSSTNDFKTPLTLKPVGTQKKVAMLFDENDLKSIREQVDEQKEYPRIKPVVITGGQWLSKEEESKVGERRRLAQIQRCINRFIDVV